MCFDDQWEESVCKRLSPLQKHVRKVVGGFRKKKSCVSTGVRKPGKRLCVTDCHDMTLAVKVALNPNTTNQPTEITSIFSFSYNVSYPLKYRFLRETLQPPLTCRQQILSH